MDAQRLSRKALLDDIQLMLDGCTKCWTFKLLDTLSQLQCISAVQWNPACATSSLSVSDILYLSFDEKSVVEATKSMFDTVFSTNQHDDPDTASSDQVHVCTYKQWIGLAPIDKAPLHMKAFMPFKFKQCLLRFRLGNHGLRIATGRQEKHYEVLLRKNVQLPRNRRYCRFCLDLGVELVEDLMHFVLKCPAYNHIRDAYPCLFDVGSDDIQPASRLCRFFNHTNQRTVAVGLYRMYAFRQHCVSNPSTTHIDAQPVGYVNCDTHLEVFDDD
eukprot:jgi/Chrzof1/13042/Cz07g17210.t1